MSKQHGKQKSRHPQEQTRDAARAARLSKLAEEHPIEQKQVTKTAESDRYKKEDERMATNERPNNPRWTERIMAIFTGALTIIAVCQMLITYYQLGVMRKDQRPWLKITFDHAVVQVGDPIGGNLNIINEGKTVAKNLEGKFHIERVQNGEQPHMDYGDPWITITSGDMYPNSPTAQAFNMERVAKGSAGPTYETVILSQPETDAFNKRDIFFVAYATLSYSDYFGIKHWTQYCTFFSSLRAPTDPVGRMLTAQNCSDYNQSDAN